MSDPHEDLLEEATRTPAWMPLLGLSLFFVAAIYLVVTSKAPDVTVEVPRADAGAGTDSHQP